MRDGREQLHAFTQIVTDATLHGVEGMGGARNLEWTILCQGFALAISPERVGGSSELRQWAGWLAHREPAEYAERRELRREERRQPCRQRYGRIGKVDAQRRTVVKMQLKQHVVCGNDFRRCRARIAWSEGSNNCPDNWGHCPRIDGRAVENRVQSVMVVSAIQLG